MTTWLESIIDYRFNNISYLHRALMRKDNLTNKPGPRTRLDFTCYDILAQIGDQKALETLGDSVVHVYILENSIKKGVTTPKDMHNRKRDHGKNLTLNQIAEKIQLQT